MCVPASKCSSMTIDSFAISSCVLYFVLMKAAVSDCGKVSGYVVPVKTLDSLQALGCDSQQCSQM